jgi:hypothetical protein
LLPTTKLFACAWLPIRLLRKAAARTIEALFAAIADALGKFSPQECANYLANSGYRRQS